MLFRSTVDAFNRLGYNCFGVDISEYAISKCNSTIKDKLRIYNGSESLQHNEFDKFDFIFTEDVEEAEEKEQREKDRERDIAYQQETRDFMSYTRARDKETDTRADRVQAEVDAITNRMQAPDYVVTTEDLTESLRLSINPLNIPNWDAITTYNAPKVVEIFGTIHQAKKY
mgnify:CR=1 FL=1